ARRLAQDLGLRSAGSRASAPVRARPGRQESRPLVAVQALYALQNGFMGFEKSGLFFGERSGERVRIPIACSLGKTSGSTIPFVTGLSPRAVPGLMRTDLLAAFTEDDLLVNRLASVDLEPENVDVVVLSHLHFDHAGGAFLFAKSELVAQQDE